MITFLQSFKKIIFYVAVLSCFAFSSAVFAAGQTNNTATNGNTTGQTNQTQTTGASNGQTNQTPTNATIPTVALKNPLKNVSSIQDLLVAILNIVMVLMIPVIVFYIIYSGFKYVTAQGNASQVEEASKSLLYAIVGGVLILGALAITRIIENVVNAF